jgi:calcineurin-like phosphoesterase family protein
MARFFTSDTHFSDDRFNLFYRPFKTVQEQEDYIVEKWNSVVGPEDEVYHVGDFATTDEGLEVVKRLNGKITLIRGNYDDPRPAEKLMELFDDVCTAMDIWIGGDEGEYVKLNHYPEKAEVGMFNIVGHIHGLWKVQRNMINVSTDAWHFTPVSEDQIVFAMTAIRKYYDDNVFAGELEQNIDNIIGTEVYAEEDIPTLGDKVFLAGPTPRSLDTESWRPEMIKLLREAGYEGHILIPEKRNLEEGYDYDTQVAWESDALDASDLIVFWVPRNLETMPGFTTNIEFGEWMKSGKIVLGYPHNADKMRYMQMKADKYGIERFGFMKDLADYVVDKIEG